jgi:hypothetical protein
MGMGSLRGERSGLTEAMKGDGKGGEIVCQVLYVAKYGKSTACTTEFTEGTESEGDERGLPARPFHTSEAPKAAELRGLRPALQGAGPAR